MIAIIHFWGIAMEPSDFVPLLSAAARKHVEERLCGRGEQLFRRGEEPRSMFYVISGEARLKRNSPAGAEVIFQRARRGFLAEASLDQPAYHCDGVIAEKTRLLIVPIADFRALLSNENVQILWLRHLGNELRRMRAQSERLALRSASDRIIHFIETEGRNGKLLLSQSKKSWAAELGLTHEALYRALRSMTENGILRITGTCIEVVSAKFT
jgi:CRP-like cAMP-binding protein